MECCSESSRITELGLASKNQIIPFAQYGFQNTLANSTVSSNDTVYQCLIVGMLGLNGVAKSIVIRSDEKLHFYGLLDCSLANPH